MTFTAHSPRPVAPLSSCFLLVISYPCNRGNVVETANRRPHLFAIFRSSFYQSAVLVVL